jgi:hypothetical protein
MSHPRSSTNCILTKIFLSLLKIVRIGNDKMDPVSLTDLNLPSGSTSGR